ncbi:hypothetical protein [Shewanella sp.]|uniref:hypothetical protein n=1 Tax=Shewanella sp. TaxID=50422 RepID=UPI003565C093
MQELKLAEFALVTGGTDGQSDVTTNENGSQTTTTEAGCDQLYGGPLNGGWKNCMTDIVLTGKHTTKAP